MSPAPVSAASASSAVHEHAARILGSLYCGEAAVLAILVGLYKARVHDWTVLSTKPGAILTAGAIGLIASGWLLAWHTRASGSSRRRAFALGLTTNLLSVLLAFLVLEAAVRTVGRRTHAGVMAGSVLIRPAWPELIAHSRQVLAGAAPWGSWDASYFVYDRELGWTVGSNRRSPDGLYFSSVEGIRSAAPNLRLAGETPRFRVALIGDSNAFSFEVPFEDSWGYHLQRLLGDEVQVLNFGVDGYGIDQVYLRYQRDVRPWHPQVVAIGFVGHDLLRTMAVYPFVSFGWPGYLVKPRFAIEKGELKLLNVPLPTPDEILAVGRIQQLPFVEYDRGYDPNDWRWQFEGGPLILRFVTSAFPRGPAADPRVSEEATQALNTLLFVRLVKAIGDSGAVSLVVSFSESTDRLERETLARAGLSFIEATDCVAPVAADRRRVASGHHYAGPANQAIARCTMAAVEQALAKAGHTNALPAVLHQTVERLGHRTSPSGQ